jgi:hypothetical protein
MDYSRSRQWLYLEFQRQDFEKAIRENKFLSLESLLTQLSSGSKLFAVYPGRKSNPQQNKYDYRVDIDNGQDRIALSHANIIVDIYNKCKVQDTLIAEMKNLFRNIIVDEESNPYLNAPNLKTYQPINKPTQSLLDEIEKAHGSKNYQRSGNQWDYTIDELVALIKWISLQEDINYPIPNYQGRRMPFARYWEAIYCAEAETHQLPEVIKRALSHTIPTWWSDLDYSFLNLALK